MSSKLENPKGKATKEARPAYDPEKAKRAMRAAQAARNPQAGGSITWERRP